MHTYLICYDLEDDRARTRVARLLESYGERVQYSVFEVTFPCLTDLEKLKRELRGLLDESGANVRFYRLTADAIAASHALDGSQIGQRDVVVII